MAKNSKEHVPLERDIKRQQKMLKLGMKLLKLQDQVNVVVEDINRLALEPWQVDDDGFPKDGKTPIEKLEQYRVIENNPVEMIFNYLHDVCDKFERFDDNPEACNKWFKFVSRIIAQTDSEQIRRVDHDRL